MSDTSVNTIERQGSLARRLAGVSLIWALVLLVLGAAALTALFRQTVMSDLEDRLSRVLESLVAQVDVSPEGLMVIQAPTDPSYGQAFSGRYWQVDIVHEDGLETALKSTSLGDERLVILPSFFKRSLDLRGKAIIGNNQGPDEEPLRIQIISYEIEDAGGVVVFSAAEDLLTTERQVTSFALTAAGLFALLAFFLAIGVYAQVRIGLSPVLRLGRDVGDVRDGRAERISGVYPVELIGLAVELNGLLDHSREVVDRARTHVGNLAHALKTPITVLSNEAHLHEGALAQIVGRQTRTMADQVEHHLRRARAAANAKSIGARTPLIDVVSDLGRTLNKIYERNGIRVSWDCPDHLVFRGERQDLEDLVGNLMDNGCKWAASKVHLDAHLTNPGQLCITISDDGPGLSQEAREQVLQRGVRLDEQAPGSGLGLSIVNDLTRAYEGVFYLEENAPNGLKVVLILPEVNSILVQKSNIN